jgi:hypothetical protein
MFSFVIMYSEVANGIIYETRFYLSENAYHCKFGAALSVSGKPQQKSP